MKKEIIVVGSGIGGLSAAYYALLNGYHVSIYEMHSLPGGLCTAWGRKGYKFDISMHMLMGSVSGPFHKMWKELGIIDNFEFHYHDIASVVESSDQQVAFYVDRHKLEAELLAHFPEDEELVREFVRLINGPHMMNGASLKPRELVRLKDSLRMMRSILPMMKVFEKYGNLSLQEYAAQAKNPLLERVMKSVVDFPGWPMPDFPMVPMAGSMQSMVREAGVPLGGSQQVVFHVAERVKKLGGVFHYNSKVTDLIVEDDEVCGIRMENGMEHRADRVIWAGDGHTLIYDILKEKYINEKIKYIYENWIPVKSIVHVMMGVDMDLSNEPARLTMEASRPINIAGREHAWLGVLHHCFDKNMAPEGKSAVEVWYDTEYDYWEELYRDKNAYKAEKQRIADYTIEELNRKWPGFADKLELVDVPTPMTYSRYTGNWKGSPDGWYITRDNMRQGEPVRSLPGLKGLWMAGQWTAPFTGTVMAALSGRQIVQLMCKNDNLKFRTEQSSN